VTISETKLSMVVSSEPSAQVCKVTRDRCTFRGSKAGLCNEEVAVEGVAKEPVLAADTSCPLDPDVLLVEVGAMPGEDALGVGDDCPPEDVKQTMFGRVARVEFRLSDSPSRALLSFSAVQPAPLDSFEDPRVGMRHGCRNRTGNLL
jgi:hypothetical protein